MRICTHTCVNISRCSVRCVGQSARFGARCSARYTCFCCLFVCLCMHTYAPQRPVHLYTQAPIHSCRSPVYPCMLIYPHTPYNHIPILSYLVPRPYTFIPLWRGLSCPRCCSVALCYCVSCARCINMIKPVFYTHAIPWCMHEPCWRYMYTLNV